MKKIVSEQKAKIIITPQLASQVSCLHNQCPQNKEWSGLLLCRILAGSVEDIDNLKISCEEVFPMDFGDASFTSFEGNEDWLTFFEKFPQVDPLKQTEEQKKEWFIAKLHSHHNMSSFHSSTDTQDLYDTAPHMPFYLSLVVNYSCIPFAEIAIAGEEEVRQTSKWKVKNWKIGKKNNELRKEKVTYVIPCEVAYQQDAWFIKQIKALQQKNTVVTTPTIGFGYKGKPTTENKFQQYGILASKTGRKVIDELSDFISLGELTKDAPYRVLIKIDDLVTMQNKVKYQKASKEYFEIWYSYNFSVGMHQASEEDVLDCLAAWCKNHTENWLADKVLIPTINELKEEYKSLQQVYGGSLV